MGGEEKRQNKDCGCFTKKEEEKNAMLEIQHFTVENLMHGCVTDAEKPHFAWALESDGQDVSVEQAVLEVNGWRAISGEQVAVPYGGSPLAPFTQYTAHLTVLDSRGQQARAEVEFETGRRETPWAASWITDGSYHFTEKKVSPRPMTFRKQIQLDKPVAKARLYATAMGIYELTLNGRKVGSDYFAPGFTSYRTHLQYQTYDVTAQLQGQNELVAEVAGGWAVGSFVFTRKNRVSADRQALLLELRVWYEDGTSQVFGTDESWQVSTDGPVQMADLYDGETYDATVTPEQMHWHAAAKETLRCKPAIRAAYGAMVKAHEQMQPVSCTTLADGTLVYDFGQNFAGVIDLQIQGVKGQVIQVRHAEILNPDGTLNTAFLRSAKATATYTCTDGEQHYSPRFTYMGFRYAAVTGAKAEQITVSARALYSDLEQIGSFACSNELLNCLQQNILWSAKSNLMDIPTDCPQRDERMGWTGDIAVFAPTACYNFDMSRFLDKWLLDVKAEQLPTGGIPNTVPVQGYGFPATMPTMAIDFWGDACVLVPWAEYQARGDVELLRRMYPTMKKYVNACRFWAGFGLGKKRYIWHTPAALHFGDWVAPDVPKMQQWQARSQWTATASLKNTSGLVARIAQILGETADAQHYGELSEKVADAYVSVFTDGEGRLKEEFQTAYVLPLYLGMFPEKVRRKAADNLVRLVEKGDWCIGTGFPGTPYILFALADNGHLEEAYRMLLNTKCPSWLYEVRMGATTIWERWDGLDENGVCPIGDDGTDLMISYNHYASGAVGAFFYQRILGLEPEQPGYKAFRFAPQPGGKLTWAKGEHRTPYGLIRAGWTLRDGVFEAELTVPVNTRCTVTLPDGTDRICGSGQYAFRCKL